MSDTLFHQEYLLEIFSYANPGSRFNECTNGRLITKLGLIRLLKIKTELDYNSLNCKKAMRNAAQSGNLKVIKWLYKNRVESHSTLTMPFAVGKGHLNIVKWLHENHVPSKEGEALQEAAHKGYRDIVVWLSENTIVYTKYLDRALHSAVVRGHTDIVIWLCEKFLLTESQIQRSLYSSTRFGHIDIVVWLCEQFNINDRYKRVAFALAVSHGHLQIIKHLYPFVVPNCRVICMTINTAIRKNHPKVAEWLFLNRMCEKSHSGMKERYTQYMKSQ